MARIGKRSLTAVVSGGSAALLIVLIFGLMPRELLERMAAPVQDRLLSIVAESSRMRSKPAPTVAIVAIDSRSLAERGAWPWSRQQVATLIDHIFAAGAKVVAIDILFDGPDLRSPAALARQLGTSLGRADFNVLAESLPDGDAALARVIDNRAAVLGFAMNADRAGALPESAAPVLARRPADLTRLWQADSAISPPPIVSRRAKGLGVLALPGDAAGMVRTVPLLVGVGGRPYPGLMLEALRLYEGAESFILGGSPDRVEFGQRRLSLPADGMLRLIPLSENKSPLSVLSAEDILSGKDQAALNGAVVFVGATAPEAGGMRITAFGALHPSVVVHAQAFIQAARGFVPRQMRNEILLTNVIAFLVSAVAIFLALGLRPAVGTAAVAFLLVSVAGATLVLLWHQQRWLDPLLPIASGMSAFLCAALADFAVTKRRAAAVQRSFEQHLSPAVVRVIADNPDLVRLSGERRVITALFTDIEGFTTMTERLGPEQLVHLLDRYFEGVTDIIIRNGGTIDKIVGDAVHAFFNAPLDQERHWCAAIDCAKEIIVWSENFQQAPANLKAGLGRTRIGIETGEAVVGDVGIGAKLDYTAHGTAINAAARLEAANKEFGSAVCIGPGAAVLYGVERLKPLGQITLRGIGREITAYTVRP